MEIYPKIRTRFGEGIGVEIFVSPPDLNENEKTFISTDATAGASSYSVDNGLMFAVGEYIAVLPGGIGASKAEINRIHTATTPTSTTITLNAVNTFAHSRGERIVYIPYNQIVIQRSTDGGTSYSDLVTIDIRLDTTETYYQHTSGAATDYYRAKFYNSASTNTSAVSDGVISTGYVDGSAGEIIRAALLSLGEKVDGEVITKEFLFQALHEGRIEMDGLVDRWSFRTEFDYDLGDIIPGRYTVDAPDDLRLGDTYLNVISMRLGRSNVPLVQTDLGGINQFYLGVAHSTLNGAITSGSTSIVLTSSGDFDESGTVDIAAESVSGTIDNAAYTTNTESTKTLGTVTSIADSHASGRDVWQGAAFGLPTHYTVDDYVVKFSQPFADAYAGENIKMDYYKDMIRADSDGDALDEPWAEDVYIPYLRWRIRKRKNPDLAQDTDSDYKSYSSKSKMYSDSEFVGQDIRIEYDM